jgi:2',3'-cyclic-nucleotide 2'-phosphodiesterase (5'-nucleotidase family)
MKIKTVFFTLVICAFFTLYTISGSTGTEGKKRIVIAYTCNVDGYLEPCGCDGTDEMLGGLYKKATYIHEYRKTEKNLVLVDSGDLFNEHEKIKDSYMPSARFKGEVFTKVYKELGIDAINVGELDLALGVDYLKELEKKYDVPFVSANIVDSKNQPLFKPYVIKTMDNIKVGIIGIMGNTPDVAKPFEEIVGTSLTVLDPVETVTAKVAELKDKVDFIIVLTHQHMGRNWIFARKINGIDVIVGGHHKQKLDTPYEANNTYIVQSSEKEQHQGMLVLEKAADGTKTATNTLVPLGSKIANDANVKAMIDEYNQEVNKLYTSAAAGTAATEETVTPRSNKCNECHAEAYEIWQKSAHAKAFQTLIDKGKQFNPDCLACHTTLFEEAGGFTMQAQQKELRDVQCENCHGDKAAHLEDPSVVSKAAPDVKTCLKCHTEYRSAGFEKNYAQKWEMIKH